ncbi:MAG: putative DNA-binding protein [Bacillaceae bacterium]|nr:putative DNA-binding protein [Bacillaceae bacterium]
MLEKTTRMNYLYDFYQSLLTPKQRNYMSLYYLDDYSLGEIAEEYSISRQAVYDNIKRTEQMLEEYEQKLLLFQKFQERQQLLSKMKQMMMDEENAPTADLVSLVEALEKLD